MPVSMIESKTKLISRLCMAERMGRPVLLELPSPSRQDHHQNRPSLSAFRFPVPALGPMLLLPVLPQGPSDCPTTSIRPL
jgi:hypothetical protein